MRNPQQHDDAGAELEPLDAFEQAWADKLAEPDPELTRTGDDFVAGVLARHDQASAAPAVVGRIGPSVGASPLPFAIAAALALAALASWYVLTQGPGNTNTPNEDSLVNADPQPAPQPDAQPAPQPGPQPEQSLAVDATSSPARRVDLGSLISQAQGTVTRPASNLTATLRDATDPPRMLDLLEQINSPVPNLKELLAPMKSADTQSRA